MDYDVPHYAHYPSLYSHHFSSPTISLLPPFSDLHNFRVSSRDLPWLSTPPFFLYQHRFLGVLLSPISFPRQCPKPHKFCLLSLRIAFTIFLYSSLFSRFSLFSRNHKFFLKRSIQKHVERLSLAVDVSPIHEVNDVNEVLVRLTSDRKDRFQR